MQRKGATNQTSWYLTLAAALFLALGPAVAPMLGSSSDSRYIEICTAFGLVKKAVEGGSDLAGQKGGDHGSDARSGHCLFCSSRQITLLPQAITLPVPEYGFLVLSAAGELQLAAVSFELAYQPRAPPVFS